MDEVKLLPTQHGAAISVASPPSGDHPSRGDLFGAPDTIPVITLWQPWASLIFTGDKKHETRGFRFPAKYAGKRVAIHAAKALPKQIPMGLHMLCEMNWGGGSRWRDELPTGAILGTVTLAESKRTEDCSPATVDRVCGDWSPGRYAWRLDDVEKLAEPLPASGKQGWWRLLASAIDARERPDREAGLDPKGESAVANGETPNTGGSHG